MVEYFVRVQLDPHFGDTYDVRMAERSQGVITHYSNVIMTTLEPGTAQPVPPLLRLEREQAQQLIDQLWLTGLRPSVEKQQEQQDTSWLQQQLTKFIDQATKGKR